MKVVYEYSHLGGSEILKVRYPKVEKEIYDVIKSVKPFKTKISKEKTMQGQALYSPIEMNKEFKDHFGKYGYHELRDTYTIEIPGSSAKIPGAFKQIDFVKGKVLVEVQFGKYAFMFYGEVSIFLQ